MRTGKTEILVSAGGREIIFNSTRRQMASEMVSNFEELIQRTSSAALQIIQMNASHKYNCISEQGLVVLHYACFSTFKLD